jgi:hypothetical protein
MNLKELDTRLKKVVLEVCNEALWDSHCQYRWSQIRGIDVLELKPNSMTVLIHDVVTDNSMDSDLPTFPQAPIPSEILLAELTLNLTWESSDSYPVDASLVDYAVMDAVSWVATWDDPDVPESFINLVFEQIDELAVVDELLDWYGEASRILYDDFPERVRGHIKQLVDKG